MSSQQANTETLSFRIGLSGTFWDKRPSYTILINDTVVKSASIESETNSIEYIEFTFNVFEECQNFLKIRLENKTDSDVVKDPPIGDPYRIIRDMLLNIHSIEIDGIELGPLMWTHSNFIADDGARPNLPGCVNLGWNGTYTLKFTSPFYLWLLENV